MGLLSTFFYNDIPVIYHVYPLDIDGIYLYSIIKKGKEQTHLYFTWYIPYIWIRTPYVFDIHGIYHVYSMYIQVSLGYTRYIPGIFTIYTTMYLFVYTSHTLYIYIVYIKYIPCIYFVYTWYILYICLK